MAKKIVTNDGKKGGWLVGKRHYDKSGKPLGGIKAVVSDAGGKPVELEGGEVIINREASKKYWKELSKINQSAGNGVAIGPPSDAFDEDPSEDYENGGKIEFNVNHVPNKWILNYAIKIKEDHPEIWDLGGNIFGNQAFINLKRVSERGYWLDSEEWMYKKWRSFVARHQRDYRIPGVIAMLKWVDKVGKGWQYMKNLIEEEIKKREAKKARKMSTGGSTLGRTPAPLKDRIKGSKFNPKGTASTSSKAESIKFDDKTIASIKSLIDTHNEKHPSNKISLAVAKAVVRRGMGAYSSSHRPTITGGKPNSRTAWGLARLKAFIYKAEKGKSKSGKYSQDNDLFEELNISVQKMNTGGKIDDGSENFDKPKNFDTHIFLHETNEQDAKIILQNGFKRNSNQVIVNGVYCIPENWKEGLLGRGIVELAFTLKPGSKIFWTNSDRPIDTIMGFGNKFYEKLYKKINQESMSPYKARFEGSDKDWWDSKTKFSRKIENWLKQNGYVGIQQGGEVVITDLDAIENIHLFNRKNKYKQGGLIAPNGKQSNLTPEQYKLVRTPEFKAWFGDWENDPKNSSKVVDENGEPLVVYRGDSSSNKKGNIFKTGFNRMGFINKNRMPNQYFHYFINQSEIAQKYAENQVEDHNLKIHYGGKGKIWTTQVTPYFINIRNYIDITPANSLFPTYEEFKKEFRKTYGDSNDYMIPYNYGFEVSKKDLYKIFQTKLGKDYLDNDLSKWDHINQWVIDQYKTEERLQPSYALFIEWKDSYNQSDVLRRVYSKMLEKNVDGLLFLENTFWDGGFWGNWRDYETGKLKYDYKRWNEKPKVYAALESNQIKLADGTNVTFDSDNPDIRFEDGGDVTSMSWYTDFKKQQLKKGTEHELEHKDTIEKFKKKGISDREVAESIAKDHLEEDENYYIELEKMEGNRFADGGSIRKQVLSSEFYDKGGNIDYDSIQPKDKNGVPKIDDKSLEILTERILKLPQTKSLHTDENGNYTKQRKELHKEIINEFKKKAVCITKGRPIAILMGGSPASGKSSFIKKYRPYLMADDIVKVDADEIRAKLPEYRGFNATQTHLETKDIVTTLISDKNIGVPCDFDLIYDGTMNSIKSYEPLIDILRKENYKIFIIYIDKVPYDTVIKRMKERYQKSGRFVPIEVIDDFFSKGREAVDKLKNQVDGYVIVDGSNFDYDIIERGGEELPQERNHKFLGKPIDKKQLEKIQYKGGGKIDGGDCYKTAGDFVIDSRLYKNKIKFVGKPHVVHAEVTGQGAISGLKYGHAWIEDDQLVYDYSNGRELVIPKDFYYAIGRVKKTKPKYFKYTFEEARKKMLDSGHYGPWDLKTESGL